MEQLLRRISAEAAKGGMPLDQAAYLEAGREPTDPVLLGSGTLDSTLGFFGRDPGRREIELGEPFVGKGGQLIRGALYRAAGNDGTPSLEESIEVGKLVFWGNTVPFKPLRNEAWSTGIKRRFLPLIRELLTEQWKGRDLITLGTHAFDWFGLAEPENKPRLREFWKREERYESSLTVSLSGKEIRLYPLPHPSPLNATWHARFPALLDLRLREIGWP
ncbi:MAG: uracil-DNA glycosylase family protein [Spirochaetaceae bacterium]